jgi:hypothetical protein
MTSSHIITSNLVMAFCLCKRKAFLLSRGDTGEPPHEYLQLINARATANQNTYLNSLSAAGFQVHQDCIGGITTSVDGSDHKRRGGTKGHQAFHRIVPTKVGKVIRVRRPMKCARHKGASTDPLRKSCRAHGYRSGIYEKWMPEGSYAIHWGKGLLSTVPMLLCTAWHPAVPGTVVWPLLSCLGGIPACNSSTSLQYDLPGN